VWAKSLVGWSEAGSYSRLINGTRKARQTVGALAHPHPEHAWTSDTGEGARAAQHDLESGLSLYSAAHCIDQRLDTCAGQIAKELQGEVHVPGINPLGAHTRVFHVANHRAYRLHRRPCYRQSDERSDSWNSRLASIFLHN
jgi:hypothetical protein